MRCRLVLSLFLIFVFLEFYQENPGESKSRAHKVMSAECVINASVENKKTSDDVFSRLKNAFNPFPYPCDSMTGVLKSIGHHLFKKIKKIFKCDRHI